MRHKSQVGEDMRQIPTGFSVQVGPSSRSAEDSSGVVSFLQHMLDLYLYHFDSYPRRFDAYLRRKNRQKRQGEVRNAPTFFRGDFMRQNRFWAKIWFTTF